MTGREIVWESWALAEEADREFRRIVLGLAIPFLAIAIVIPWIKLATPVHNEAVYHAPPQVIDLLPEVKPPEPVPPKAEPKPEPKPETKPEPKPVEKPVPPPPKPQPTQEDRTREARKIAENAGINDLRKSLGGLTDQSLNQTQVNNSAASLIVSKGAAGGPPAFGASAGIGSGGIGGAGATGVSSSQGGTGLGSRQTAAVQAPGGTAAARARAPLPGSGPGGRTREEIQQTFDRGKGPILAIFNRAARDDASISTGRIVVSFTIAPDGSVTACHVVSSSYSNPELEEKIVQRVQLLNFGPKPGPPYTYPDYVINYVP